MTNSPILTTGPVARDLNVSEARVRQLAESGELPSIRTANGQRLFIAEDVARLKAQREQRSR